MKLFLSYATENAAIAEEIFFALVGDGHEVFFDQPSLNPGDNYDKRLRKAVEASDGVVFLISPKSIKMGSYTLTELKYARRKWVHPEKRVLPVIVEFTCFEDIPAYLKAVTILKPEGNVAAEVVDALKNWTKPTSIIKEHNGMLPQTVGLLAVVLNSILIAAALGTVFSLIYPRVEVDFALASLFVIVGMVITITIRGLWKTMWRNKK